MIESYSELPVFVVRATILLSVAALLAACGVRLVRNTSPRSSCIIWSMVLVCGAILTPVTLAIPWYEPHAVIGGDVDVLTSSDDYSALPAELAEAIERNESAVQTSVAPAQTPSLKSSGILRMLWVAGIGLAGLLGAVSYFGLLWALRSTWRPQRCWQHEHTAAAEAMGLKRSPRFVVHAHLGPFLCLTPTGHRLVVPADSWASLSPAERNVVLRHELAHYVRGDLWRSLPIRAIVLLHWFNPLAWLAARRVEEATEWASDRLAVGSDRGATADLANALLKLSQRPGTSQLLAAAASGRSLTQRLKNLVSQNDEGGEKSMFGKITVMTLLAGLITAGAVQVRLVAQEREGKPGQHAPELNELRGAARIDLKAAKEFAAKLRGDDELTTRLRKTMQTEPGAMVLRDRAGSYEAKFRQEAIAEAFPRFFSAMFDTTERGLELKKDKQDFGKRYLAASKAVRADIEILRRVLGETATKMEIKTDTDKLFHRFITHDTAPVILYVKHLRPRMRTGSRIVERVLQDLFAKDRNGEYQIRAQGRERAEESAARFEERAKTIARLQREVAEYADEIADIDDYHRKIRASLKNPLFAARLGLESMKSDPSRKSGLVEHAIRRLENAFREAGDGLVVRDEVRDHLTASIEASERVTAAAGTFRAALTQFADRVSDKDDVHRTWKKILVSDLLLVQVAAQAQYATAGIREATGDFLSHILKQQENGKLHVSPTNFPRQQLVNEITEMFRQHRISKRRGRQVDEFIAKIADRELKAAFESVGGKTALSDFVRERINRDVPDGFDQFVKDHFAQVGDGCEIRPTAREQVERMIRQATELSQELENDDF